MFAANSDFQIRPRLPSLFHRNLHQLAHAFLIDGGKRIALQYPTLNVSWQEFADVVAREPISRLRKIVSPKAEELSVRGDLIGHGACARQLNHGADHVLNFGSLLFEDLLRDLANDGALVFHFFHHADKRHHDFRKYLYPFFRHIHYRFKNGPRLHLRNFRISNSQPTAAVSQHGVQFMQLFYATQQLTRFFQPWRIRIFDFQLSDFHHQLFAARQKLMQRRIQKADSYRETIHGFEHTFKI